MKQFFQLLFVVIAVAFAASCGPSTPTTQSKQVIATVQIDTDQYHVGQYVYIHGEVKGIIKPNNGCGCSGSGNGKYKVVVCGTTGESHIWYVNDDELSTTRDTIITRVIYSDSLISRINRINADQQAFNQDTKNALNVIQKAVAQDINLHKIP